MYLILILLQVNALRLILADILEKEEEWSSAAKVLTGISLDAGGRYAIPKFYQSHLMSAFLPARTRRSYEYMSVLYGCTLKKKTLSRRNPITIAQRRCRTPQQTKSYFSVSSSVKPASMTTPVAFSKLLRDTSNSVMYQKLTKKSENKCCKHFAF